MPRNSHAQSDESYDEIIVSANIAGIGNYDIPAIIKNDTAYLSVASLFDILNIKNNTSKTLDSLSGFFISLDSTYLLDFSRNAIVRNKKTYNLNEGSLLKSETGIYASCEVFNDFFGLACKYNVRTLTVKIVSKYELPAMREARLSLLRNNMARLKNTQKADTTIRNSYPLFHFGMLDWSVVSNQLIENRSDTRINIGLGGIIAGGETNVLLNYSPNQKLNEKQQYYQWRMVNNNSKIIRQVQIGKIALPTVASIFAPIVGAQISNVSTLIKRSFSTYAVSNYTEPGWTVELYVNNVLIDYKKADANGFYTFEVPLIYGSSAIKLRFYGPFGEERSKEESINIPFNLLTPHLFEYTISSGIVEDDSNSLFGKANLNYGISKRLTVGSGIEYLSTVRSGNYMPFVNTSFRIGRSLLMSGEYNYNVRTRGVLNYRTRSSMQFELSYTQYDKNQTAVNTQVLEERKAIVGIPIRLQKFSLFSQFTFNQSYLASTSFVNAEWLMSGFLYGMDINISTYGIFYENIDPNIYSNYSVSFRVPFRLQFRSQLQYKYNANTVVSIKESLEKSASKNLYAGLYYEQNFTSNVRNIGLQFRYNFNFAQIGLSSTMNNNNFSLLESARGSVIFDSKSNYVGFSNVNSTGRSGVCLAPFLDINCNGIKDPGEPKLSGLKFHMNGGNVLPEGKDTVIRILNLEPNNRYFLELNKFSFDNISWQIKTLTYNIETEGNRLKYIPIPVAVVGEVNGTVYSRKNGSLKGQGQVYVCVYRDSVLVSKVLSEPDGYFSYIGLPPGKYIAKLDSVQMEKINKKATAPIEFIINANKDGDVVDGLEFTISGPETDPDNAKVDTTVLMHPNSNTEENTEQEIATNTLPKGAFKGYVVVRNKKRFDYQGKIYVTVYKDGSPIARVLTNQDGSFVVNGLTDGKYILKIDEQQLRNIHLIASQPIIVNADSFTKTDGYFLLSFNDAPFGVNRLDGNVVSIKDNIIRGVGRVYVQIFRDKRHVASVRTKPDGSFVIPYLRKGVYTINIDPGPLTQIGYTSAKPITVTINGTSKTENSLLFILHKNIDGYKY